jgi:hypothetical protein
MLNADLDSPGKKLHTGASFHYYCTKVHTIVLLRQIVYSEFCQMHAIFRPRLVYDFIYCIRMSAYTIVCFDDCPLMRMSAPPLYKPNLSQVVLS